jgi:hypothetical protein
VKNALNPQTYLFITGRSFYQNTLSGNDAEEFPFSFVSLTRNTGRRNSWHLRNPRDGFSKGKISS